MEGVLRGHDSDGRNHARASSGDISPSGNPLRHAIDLNINVHAANNGTEAKAVSVNLVPAQGVQEPAWRGLTGLIKCVAAENSRRKERSNKSRGLFLHPISCFLFLFPFHFLFFFFFG